MLHLTPRLKAIADSIFECNMIADIGSDHAYLPIFLIKNKQIKKAIASDINIGPANISRERIRQYGLGNVIDVRVGYGLKVLEPNEANVIIISGMGGLLIVNIIKESQDIARNSQMLILQPMKDGYQLRKWLVENFFDIIDEEIVKEENKFYEIIWAVPADRKKELQNVNIIGDKLLEKNNPILLEYIDGKISEYQKILEKLKDHNTPNVIIRRNQCNDMLGYYKEAKRCIQQNVQQ